MSVWQKWQPFEINDVENAYPRAEMEVIDPAQTGQHLCSEGQVLNPLSLLLLDFALPVANKLVLTSDRVYLCACTLPRDVFLRAFRRIAPIGASYPEWIILSRIGDLIPNRISHPALHP